MIYEASPLPKNEVPISGTNAQSIPAINGGSTVICVDSDFAPGYNLRNDNVNQFSAIPVSVQICINGSPYNIDIYSVDGTAYQGTLNYPPTHA